MIILMLGWLHASVAHARPPVPDFTPKPEQSMRPIQEACFPSGLRVTLREDHREPLVTLSLTVDVGRIHDPEGREGAAELLAHATSRATLPSGGSVRDRLFAAGASWKVEVMDEVTVYMTEAPLAALPDILAVEALRLGDPLAGVDEAVLAEVADVARAQLARRQPLTPETLLTAMPPDLFPASVPVLRRATTLDTLSAVTLADVRALAARHTPRRSTLYLSGDLSVGEAVQVVQAGLPETLLFVRADGTRPEEGDCSRPPRPTWTPIAPPSRPEREGYDVVEGAANGVWMVWGWPLPAGYGLSEPIHRLSEVVLDSRGRIAIVNFSTDREVRFEPTCDLLPGRVASAMFCRVRVPPGTRLEVLEEKIAERWSTGLAEEKLYVLMGHARQVVGLSRAIGELGIVRDPLAPYDIARGHFSGAALWHVDDLVRYSRIDPPDVFAYVRTWMDPAKAAVRIVVPWGTDPAPILAGRLKPDFTGDQAVPYRIDVEPSASDEPLPETAIAVNPDVHPTGEVLPPRLGETRSVTLPNGVRIVAVHHGDLTTVRVALQATGGSLTEPARGLSAWAWDQLSWPREEVPKGGYKLAATTIAATIWKRFDVEGPVIGMDGPRGNLDGMLWLLRRAADGFETRPDYNYRRERRFAGQDAVVRLDADPNEQARKARVAHALGPTHPLTLNRWERIKEGSGVPEQVLVRYTQAAWRPDTTTVVILGGIDTKDAIELATTMFSDWDEAAPATPVGPPAPPPAYAPAGPISLRKTDPGSPVAEVAVACAVRQGAEATALVGAQVLRQVLGAAVEDDRLALQAPTVHLPTWGDDRYADIIVQTAPPSADAASAAMVRTIDALAAGGPDATQLSAAQAFVTRQHVVQHADEGWVFDKALRHGGDVGTWGTGLADRVAAVSADDVKAWITPCAGRQAVTVVAPP